MNRLVVQGLVFFLPLLVVAGPACAQQTAPAEAPYRMTQAGLEQIIHEVSSEAEGKGGVVQFVIDGVLMACISDTTHDRMRIVSPIIDETEMTDQQKRAVLAANFHTALDARYATSDGVLYATFIHPLSPLTEEELASALHQVAALARNFGTTYSSDALLFGGRNPDQ